MTAAVPFRRSAFTLVELMVSMGLLLLAMLTVAGIFHLSSDAAGQTAAHGRLLDASAAVSQRLGGDISRIVPGLLIIESPPPTRARAEVKGEAKYFRLRHDRLVFFASYGAEGAFESYSDPTVGTPADPTRAPATGSEALVYFGPGIPVRGDGTAAGEVMAFDDESIALSASEWVYLHRAILLLPDYVAAEHPDWNAPVGPSTVARAFTGATGMFAGGTLVANLREFYEGYMDAVIPDGAGGLDASAATLLSFLGAQIAAPAGFQAMFHENPGPADARAMWEPSLAPITANFADPTDADYFIRSGATLMQGMADVRIEWTDGRRIDPLGPDDTPNTGDEDLRTRWYGLAPTPLSVDASNEPDLSDPDGLRYMARLRGRPGPGNPSDPNDAGDGLGNPDNDPAATAAFFDRIEGSWQFLSSGVNARYRAVWAGTDYTLYRPKALRISYRIYGKGARLRLSTTLDLNEDGVTDTDTSGAPLMATRIGQDFSIVLPVP